MERDAIIDAFIYPALAEVLSDNRIDAEPHLRPDTACSARARRWILSGWSVFSRSSKSGSRRPRRENRVGERSGVFTRPQSFRTVGSLADFVASFLASDRTVSDQRTVL